MHERIIPQLPSAERKMRVLIDTDFANEIDDLYALALALRSPERFAIEGIVATHFAQKSGRESIEQSYLLLLEMLAVANVTHRVERGGDPMRYRDEPSDSPGARLIIERAHAGSADDPLWVVGLGAATNLASALLLDPDILPKVRYVYHARSELTWPARSLQFNVAGDINAARALLLSTVPLVWFDTGQQLTCPMDVTERRLRPLGALGAFLHDFRSRNAYFQRPDKGFFDVGDIAWMIDPSVCTAETIDAPEMNWMMEFHHSGRLGKMLRVHTLKPEPVWDMFFDRLSRQ